MLGHTLVYLLQAWLLFICSRKLDFLIINIILKIKKLEFSIIHNSKFGDFGIFIRQNTLTNIILPNSLKTIETIPSENKSAFMIKVRSQLNQYFKGVRQTFDLKVDLNMSPFFINTLEEVKKIPYGSTRSYKDIANKIKWRFRRVRWW